jgi:hypothetical protein
MRIVVAKALVALAFLFAGFGTDGGRLGAQPGTVDTSNVGPQVGATVPAFSGVDQFGRTQMLASALGAKGAMLVFFRSADW